jgi:DnaJ-class molecular chaperone
MDKPKDYYQLLGVPRNASTSAIRRAFLRLSRRRPARGSDDESHSLAELRAAYETLTDAERRRSYDDQLRAERPAPAPDWPARVRHPAHSDLRRPITPTTLAAEILVTPDDAARGTVLSLDIPVTATCAVCGGTGGSVFDCGRCGGEGQVSRRLPVPVHLPAATAEGAVFQVRTDDAAVPSILLTVHVRRPF